MTVTDQVILSGCNAITVGSFMTGADSTDYFFCKGIKECIDGVKDLLAVVEDSSVTASNVGSYINGAVSRDYYTLKALQELFDAKGF